MIEIAEAREWLRLDGTDNDEIIGELVSAAPSYIEATTGLSEYAQATEPLADTVTKFLITLWYNAEQAEAERLQRTIDGLLKVLSIKAKELK